MPPAHVALAVLVVGIWGTNFVVIHAGLAAFGPFTFAALRSILASLPLILFIRRPKIAAGALVAYGLAISVGQTGLMLYALAGHISPGLASLLIQTQAFFTVALAVVLSGERVRAGNIAALGLCTAGIVLIAVNMGGDVSPAGILLVVAAAFSWGIGNIVAKRAGAIDMLALVAWSNLVAVPPLLAAALLLDGPDAIQSGIAEASAAAWGTVLWQAIGNALFGYAAWNWLLARHPAADVAPMGLLVPIFGMSAAAWVIAEPMPPWKLAAAALVLAGLAVNLATGRRAARPPAA